jgi:hypothetical protein
MLEHQDFLATMDYLHVCSLPERKSETANH